MADYIDREAVLMKLMQDGCSAKNVHAIMGIPAADVEPVRRGHWIEENGCQICSECGEEHEWDEYRAAYCDVCGAKMDGGDEFDEDRKSD